MLRRCLYISVCCGLLLGCGERLDLAPVVESHWRGSQYAKQHVVIRGETLYSIAFRYDKDYRQLAYINHIQPPYLLHVGQRLILQSSGYHNKFIAKRNPKHYQLHQIVPRTSPKGFFSHGQWAWPAQGHVVSSFMPTQGKKGINIAGHQGEKIHAAANGVVAYAGNGLAGYGNLIIIKHSNQFLTAYGNNARNLVIEGQTIHKGQIIAEMGIIDHHYWGLHFEIRQAGHPVNPLNYLH